MVIAPEHRRAPRCNAAIAIRLARVHHVLPTRKQPKPAKCTLPEGKFVKFACDGSSIWSAKGLARQGAHAHSFHKGVKRNERDLESPRY